MGESASGRMIDSVLLLEPRHNKSPLIGLRFDNEAHYDTFSIEKQSIWYREYFKEDIDVPQPGVRSVFHNWGKLPWTTPIELLMKKSQNGFLSSLQIKRRLSKRNLFRINYDLIEFRSLVENAPLLTFNFLDYGIDENSSVIFFTISRGRYVILLTKYKFLCFELVA